MSGAGEGKGGASASPGGTPPRAEGYAPSMRRDGTSSTLRRAALLLAALLHLAGAAALPVLHALGGQALAGPEAGLVLRAPDEAPSAPAAAHDELSCAACQALGAAVLLPESAAPFRVSDAAPAPLPSVPALHAAPRGGLSLARAPPALS